MGISKNQIERVAKLANLPLSDDEKATYSEQLSNILAYIEKLDKVDTKETEPTFNVTGLENVMSEDIPCSSLNSEEALSGTPSTRDSYFITKGVFDE